MRPSSLGRSAQAPSTASPGLSAPPCPCVQPWVPERHRGPDHSRHLQDGDVPTARPHWPIPVYKTADRTRRKPPAPSLSSRPSHLPKSGNPAHLAYTGAWGGARQGQHLSSPAKQVRARACVYVRACARPPSAWRLHSFCGFGSLSATRS